MEDKRDETIEKQHREFGKVVKAKDVSLVIKIVASLLLIGFNIGVLVILKRVADMNEQLSILAMVFGLIGLFGDVTLAIILDKFTKKKGFTRENNTNN